MQEQAKCTSPTFVKNKKLYNWMELSWKKFEEVMK